jgi:hypothetical protein
VIDPPAAGTVVFESVARPLLLVHAVVGFTAVGTSTHFAAYAVIAALRGSAAAQLRRFATLAPAALAAQALLGYALYPTYRVRVRLADLDRSAPAVAQLFDLKEHLAALALALVAAAALAVRAGASAPAGARTSAQGAFGGMSTPPGGKGSLRNRAVAALATSGAALVWAAAIIGLYVTARHPVGGR